MTELMTKALEALRKLPEERQDEVAPFLLALADDEPCTEADAAAIAEAQGAVRTRRAGASRDHARVLGEAWAMIVYAPRALDDLRAIEAYLHERNPAAARGVLEQIKRTIEMLAVFRAGQFHREGRLGNTPRSRFS
jgi:hypothetical protein